KFLKAVDRSREARRLPEGKYWTKELVARAVQEWERKRGRPPVRNDWAAAGDHPSGSTIYKLFGSWGAMLAYAGYDGGEDRRRWSPQAIVDAIDAWAKEHGRAPLAEECKRSRDLPDPTVVAR